MTDFVKLGMWVVLGTNVTYMVCCHQMCTLNSSFVYLFCLANKNKGQYQVFYMSLVVYG